MATFEEREYEQEPIVIECEVRRALKELANGKVPGANGIPIELLKVVWLEVINILRAICTQICSRIVWHKRLKQSVYIPLTKKGDARECSNAPDSVV